MSQELINLSPDLQQLRNEGYEIEINHGYALIHNVPYVNSNREIKYGTLVSFLNMAGNKTTIPDTHVINFIGEHPCNRDGSIMTGIQHTSSSQVLAEGITVTYSFSNKPQDGYRDYYEKFTTYIEIIMAPAFSIDNSVTAKTFKVVETPEDSVFHYYDTNSSRASINEISRKFNNQRICIIGLGGTGSYILDFVSKTPVAEIHLYDNDDFLQHNAFRTPGAASIEKLRQKPKKTDYLLDIYSNMHKNIISHPEFINENNLENLVSMDFVFICIDQGPIKKDVIKKLVDNKVPFIDVGIGIQVIDNMLIGQVRATTSTPLKNDHLSNRISVSEVEKDEYSTNIQIAELNAFNAAMAVIKWKKIFGFYQDLSKEHHTVYDVNIGELIIDDQDI